MPGSIYKDPKTFSRLGGDIPLCRARLVTTMWDIAKDVGAAKKREMQLKGDFWRKLIDEGAVARRFDNSHKCAWEIVEDLISLGQNGEADQENHLTRKARACTKQSLLRTEELK